MVTQSKSMEVGSTSDDGGPAFPTLERGYGGLDLAAPGMSLRDYFAAKAMHQMIAGAVLPPGYDATNDLIMVGDRAYELADAMLKARSKALGQSGGTK